VKRAAVKLCVLAMREDGHSSDERALTRALARDYSNSLPFLTHRWLRERTLKMARMAGSILDGIITARRRRLTIARARMPLVMLKEAINAGRSVRDFAAAISGPGVHVIAEMKQASPSRSVLRKEYRPREIAQGYEAGGAAALSVLTEEDFFHGSLTDLIDARDSVGLPALRKDFIVEAYQVYESAAAGADALLLIVAALGDKELRELLEVSRSLRIAALVEVHTEEELKRAIGAGAQLIGVNNRNLKTLDVDLETSFRLRAKIPAECVAISESGIKTPEDLRRLAEAGFNAVLVGESLLVEDDPGRQLARLLEGARSLAS
jgi:indole-3-glycerol phosphate synthase